ncbi:MAG: histidinol dehydrogenase, partial [Polyangiaceae bacterium]
MIRILNYSAAGDLIRRKTARLDEAERVVVPIVADIRARGDAAVLEYARKFDGFEGSSLRVGRSECDSAKERLAPEFVSAVELAARNIREYAAAQLPRESTIEYT